MKTFPKASRPLEYVAFFTLEISTMEGPGYVYFACDAYSEFAFNTGVESNDDPDTILKHLYLLTEHPEFVSKMGQGFTLVLKDFQELSERIQLILNTVNGKLLFDKDFNDHISKPVRVSFGQFVGR